MVSMKLFWIFQFILVYLWELTKANLQVVRAVLSPQIKIRPGFIRIPIELKNEHAQLLLANLITMTPGTVTIDLSNDRQFLFIHSFDVSSPDSVREEIQHTLEAKIKRLFQ